MVCFVVESRIDSTGLVVIVWNFVIVPLGNCIKMIIFGVKSFVNEFDWIVGMTCFRGEVGVSFLGGGCLK